MMNDGMSFYKIFYKIMRISAQVALLWLCALIGDELVHLLKLNIPGSLAGMLLLFGLLKFKLLKLEWVESGANWLLAELLLFFIPSSVGVLPYMNLLEAEGARLYAVIAVSTLVVMTATGLVAEFARKR
jgi:holin-like protein